MGTAFSTVVGRDYVLETSLDLVITDFRRIKRPDPRSKAHRTLRHQSPPTATDSDPNVGAPGVTKAVLGGTTLGVFIRVVTGLSSGTAYSFKAYAINANGTSHTTVGTFTTSGTVDPAFSPSNPPKIIRLVGGAVSVSSVGIPSRTYGVQRSINLSSWTQIGTPMAAANGAVTLTDPTPPQPRAFYRLIFPAQ